MQITVRNLYVQQALVQLDKLKASCKFLIKVPLRTEILINFITLDLKSALPMLWNNPISATTQKQTGDFADSRRKLISIVLLDI